MSKYDFYIASPLFTDDHIELIEQVETALYDANMTYFSPRLASKITGLDTSTPEIAKVICKSVYKKNVDSIHECDKMIAIMKYPDIGTLYEIGYLMGTILKTTDEHGSALFQNKLSDKLLLIHANDLTRSAISYVASILTNPSKFDRCNELRTVPMTGTYFICIDDRPVQSFILMGALNALSRPFYTYSKEGHGSNIMIAAASQGHLDSDIVARVIEGGISLATIEAKCLCSMTDIVKDKKVD